MNSSSRIYVAERNGSIELLVLLNSACSWDSWGHVFFDGEKWICSLLGVSGYFGGKTDKEIINDFWRNIKQRMGWRDLCLKEHLKDISYSSNFTEAVQELRKIIGNYELEDEDTFNGYEIYEVYGTDILISGSKYYR
ncbi:MAG: hypothetical protein GY694_00225 [Gammaproteobacteria bacterium]|nr:hypothetical protein [Gammaproteobacteria bacterium]